MNYKDLQWKPIVDESFSRFLVDTTGQSYDYHPIIIMEMDDDLIFLKAQTAKYYMQQNSNLEMTSNQKRMLEQKHGVLVHAFKENVLYSKQDVKPLFKSASIVDTTELYIMSKNDFARFYKINEDLVFYNTRALSFDSREEILTQLKANLNKNEVAITAIRYDRNLIKTQLITTTKKRIEQEKKNHLEQTNLSNDKKQKLEEKINIYLAEYQNYKKHNEQFIDGYLQNIKDTVSKELDNVLDNDAIIDEKTDPYVFLGIAKEFALDLNDQVYLDWSAKAYNQANELSTLSSFEKDYYNDYPAEFLKHYPDIKEEYRNFCKETKYTKMQGVLINNEQEAKKLNAKEIQKQCTDLRYGVTLANYKNFEEQQRNNYHQKVNNTTKQLDVLKEEKDLGEDYGL